MTLYHDILSPIFFRLDPEAAHDSLRAVGRMTNSSFVRSILSVPFAFNDPRLIVKVAGLDFVNPVGLGAGFDKNAELLGIFSAIGFGHLELGTVTGRAQPGNPRPRIFRLTADRALINRMGFPSIGADAFSERLRRVRAALPKLPILGANIGKSKDVPLEQAVDDYRYSYRLVAPLVSYVTVNVSSPNTQGLRQLQDRDRLTEILRALRAEEPKTLPLFVKVAPDLSESQLDEVVQVCLDCHVSGIIATNTTLSRDGLAEQCSEQGGLSGAPLRGRVSGFVSRIRSRVDGSFVVIGVGGVDSAAAAAELISAGADLVQVYTALIYEGPGLIKRINSGLVRILDQLGLKSVGDLRGVPPEAIRSKAGNG